MGAVLFLYGTQPALETIQKNILLIQIALITIFIPLTMLYLFMAMGKIDSIMVSETSQRKMPLLIQIVLMSTLLYKGIPHEIIPELFFFYFGGIVGAFMAFLLLFFGIKASIHTLGMSALAVYAIGLSLHSNENWTYGIALLIVLNGLVISSRLVMKAHQMKEIVLGLFLGVFSQAALLRFWL